MFRKLAQIIDNYSIRLTLGTLQRKRAWELEKAGLSEKEAATQAQQEILESMRNANLDIRSREEVTKWAKSFHQETKT